MLWIGLGVIAIGLVTAWARASTKKFHRESADRVARRGQNALDRQEEALLARLRDKDKA